MFAIMFGWVIEFIQIILESSFYTLIIAIVLTLMPRFYTWSLKWLK